MTAGRKLLLQVQALLSNSGFTWAPHGSYRWPASWPRKGTHAHFFFFWIPEKHRLLLYWLCQIVCVDHNKLWEILKEVGMPDHLTWEMCMQVKKQQLEPDMEQQTGSKSGKEYIKAVYCHLAYLTYMQSTSCEVPGWMKHKLESRLPGEISITSDMQMTPPYGRKWRGTKACWWKWKRRVKKLA